MSNYSIVPDAALTATADAIRTKSGSQSPIEFDHNTGFKSAVDAIPSASMGGLANMVDVNSSENLFGYMISAMKNGQTVGGTITVTTAFPNTESLFLSTGLSQIHGLILCNPIANMSTSEVGQTPKFSMFLLYNNENYPTSSYIAYGFSMQNSHQSQWGTIGTENVNGPTEGTIRFDGGDIYYKARYNRNDAYQIIRTNVQYEWLAW